MWLQNAGKRYGLVSLILATLVGMDKSQTPVRVLHRRISLRFINGIKELYNALAIRDLATIAAGILHLYGSSIP